MRDPSGEREMIITWSYEAWSSAVAQYEQKEVTDQNTNLPVEPEVEVLLRLVFFIPHPCL